MSERGYEITVTLLGGPCDGDQVRVRDDARSVTVLAPGQLDKLTPESLESSTLRSVTYVRVAAAWVREGRMHRCNAWVPEGWSPDAVAVLFRNRARA